MRTEASAGRIDRLRQDIADMLNAKQATQSEGTSALASLLLDALVSEIAAGNPKVAAEMLRMADRLTTLANTPPAQVEAVSTHLADRTTMRRQ